MPHEPPLEHPEPVAARAPTETWRILFLDSSDNIELLKGTCRDEGYVVVGATVVAEAWAFLEGQDHADVIVCAAHLADESMFEFLREVRASEKHRDTTFLILALESGAIGSRLHSSTEVAGLALGADQYLTMPRFDACALIDHLRRLRPAVPHLQR